MYFTNYCNCFTEHATTAIVIAILCKIVSITFKRCREIATCITEKVIQTIAKYFSHTAAYTLLLTVDLDIPLIGRLLPKDNTPCKLLHNCLIE